MNETGHSPQFVKVDRETEAKTAQDARELWLKVFLMVYEQDVYGQTINTDPETAAQCADMAVAEFSKRFQPKPKADGLDEGEGWKWKWEPYATPK